MDDEMKNLWISPASDGAQPEKSEGPEAEDPSITIAELPFSEGLKKELYSYVKHAKEREAQSYGCAIVGCPDAVAKTILRAIRTEFGDDLQMRTVFGDNLEKEPDLAANLTNQSTNDILAFYRAERLKPFAFPHIIRAIVSSRLNFTIGKGPCAKTIDLPLNPFRVILFYEKKENIPFEMFEGLYCIIDLSRYASDLRKELILSSLAKYGLSATDQALTQLAKIPYSDRDLLFYLYELRNRAFAADVREITEDFLKGEPTNLPDAAIVDNMEGREFELFAGDLFRRLGFTNVAVTPSSGDFGADVLAEKDDVRYAIQCKRYGGPVGVSAVQEVIASKSLHDCHVACVLTNSTYTPAACELAKKNLVILWDREKLKELIERSRN